MLRRLLLFVYEPSFMPLGLATKSSRGGNADRPAAVAAALTPSGQQTKVREMRNLLTLQLFKVDPG